jgi:hypothetical protein
MAPFVHHLTLDPELRWEKTSGGHLVASHGIYPPATAVGALKISGYWKLFLGTHVAKT